MPDKIKKVKKTDIIRTNLSDRVTRLENLAVKLDTLADDLKEAAKIISEKKHVIQSNEELYNQYQIIERKLP